MNTTLSPYYEDINKGNPQHCKIYVTPLSGSQQVLTEAHIKDGGLRYDAKTTSGETLELGSAIAAQLELTLVSSDWMNTYNWYGARLLVQIGVETGDSVIYGNIGEFVVDEADKRYDVWKITALDNLVRLDRTVTEAEWATINGSSLTVSGLVSMACGVCGVPMGTIHANAVNTTLAVPTLSANETTTWRNIVQWCAAITCSVAYCDESGCLCFGWYDDTTVESDAIDIDLPRRYRSNVAVGDITITGLTVTLRDGAGNATEYVYPSPNGGDYQLTIEDNPLFTTANATAAVNAIGGKVRNLTYCPFSAQTVPFIYLQPLDACFVWVVDGAGYTVRSIVTHITYTLNGSSTIEAVGKSVQSKSYANGSAFTPSQAMIIDTVREQITHYVNERDQAVQNLNNLMANAMGLQSTTINGIWYAYYAPNNEGIKNATIVYTLNNEGFFWANGGFDPEHPEQTSWNKGIDKNGNAVLAQLNVTGMTVAKGDTSFSTEITPSGWSLKNYGNPLMTASVATGEGILTLQKTIVGNYIKIGKARLYGTTNGMDIVIED